MTSLVASGGGKQPPLALRPETAAASLGISRDMFDAEVAPFVRCVRLGRLRVYPVTELQKWLDRQAALPLEGERR